MRMISVDYKSLDLFVRFDYDDADPEGIYAFAGRDQKGQDKYTCLGNVLTEQAQEQIFDTACKNLQDVLKDEADEARYIADTCYDTPYRMAA